VPGRHFQQNVVADDPNGMYFSLKTLIRPKPVKTQLITQVPAKLCVCAASQSRALWKGTMATQSLGARELPLRATVGYNGGKMALPALFHCLQGAWGKEKKLNGNLTASQSTVGFYTTRAQADAILDECNGRDFDDS
jgi:hypothetical protein